MTQSPQQPDHSGAVHGAISGHDCGLICPTLAAVRCAERSHRGADGPQGSFCSHQGHHPQPRPLEPLLHRRSVPALHLVCMLGSVPVPGAWHLQCRSVSAQHLVCMLGRQAQAERLQCGTATGGCVCEAAASTVAYNGSERTLHERPHSQRGTRNFPLPPPPGLTPRECDHNVAPACFIVMLYLRPSLATCFARAGVTNILAYSWPSHCIKYLDHVETIKVCLFCCFCSGSVPTWMYPRCVRCCGDLCPQCVP